MNENLISLLDEIARITFQIYSAYNHIIYTEVNEEYLDDYDDRINMLNNKLANLRIEEDKLYALIEDNPGAVAVLINYLNQNENDKMNDEARLCFMRIKNNLEILLYLSPIDILKVGINVFKNDPKHIFLINNGVDEDDAIEFAGKFRFSFEKSTSFRYVTFVNYMIGTAKNLKEKAALLKMKFELAFTSGNEVEEELMSHHFKTVKNNLSEEIQNNYGIDPLLKRDYLNMIAMERILHNLSFLSSLVPSISATKLLIEFKTLILYLDNTNIENLKKIIKSLLFNSEIIKMLLLEAISLNEDNKKMHDTDSNQKSL